MRQSANTKKQLPVKWIAAIIAVIVLYGFLQPTLNTRLGWTLPSVASLLGDSPPANGSPSRQPIPSSSSTPASTNSADSRTEDAWLTLPTSSGEAGSSEELLYGLLKETDSRRQEYISPEGLRYTRGSQEGHRLQHLARHLEDQPSRPGKHGVFTGDMPQVLGLLDEAYERGRRGDRGTSKRNEDGRSIYEVSFDEPIGYIGGNDGRRAGNPTAKKIRLVVDGDRLITAFPF